MIKLTKNEILILKTFNSLQIPAEVLYEENPLSCGVDMMVLYEEMSGTIDSFLKNKTVSHSFIFDKGYENAIGTLIDSSDIELKIFASMAYLCLQIIKKYI